MGWQTKGQCAKHTMCLAPLHRQLKSIAAQLGMDVSQIATEGLEWAVEKCTQQLDDDLEKRRVQSLRG